MYNIVIFPPSDGIWQRVIVCIDQTGSSIAGRSEFTLFDQVK